MNREQAVKRAEELVAKMTVEEAASQLRYDSPAIERLGIPGSRRGLRQRRKSKI